MKRRTQNRDIPKYPVECEFVKCVYNKNHICDSPRINKRNSDAVCHKMSNGHIIVRLKIPLPMFPAQAVAAA
jgi:hypothetical protein